MNDDNLKEIFRQAADIAKVVPKELREVAFNRALDALLKSSVPQSQPVKSPPSTKRPKTENSLNTIDATTDPVNALLENLDRTKYPEISNALKVLERALFLLRAARDDYGVDGLGASQIATILTEKFRLRTSRQAVSQALSTANDKVDRIGKSRNVFYRIMKPGEDYLDKGNFSSKNTTRKTKKTSSQKSVEPKQSTSKDTKQSRKTGRPGPGAILKQLAESGFFAEYRSIADIQVYCEQNLAHKYQLNELSTPLRRAIHNGLLTRKQNEDGQYEYIAE